MHRLIIQTSNMSIMMITHPSRFFQPMTMACILLMVSFSCKHSSDNKYTVIKGEFIQSVTESGELEAIDASNIFMPRIDYRYGYSFKIIGIVDHGTMVQKGDSVVALDPSSIHKYIIQQEEALDKAKAKAEKQSVQARIKRRDLEIQLRNEEASYDLKRLELERMQFESDSKKNVKELECNKALLRLEKIKRNLALYPLLEKNDRLINELEIQQRLADVQNATEVLENLVLYSPGNGYFIINDNRRGGKSYVLGDEVYMGSMIASIPDVSRMKAKSFIHEKDISRVKEGMKVIIRLDALPDMTFEASVKEISKICTVKDKQRIFDTVISIKDEDNRLKPGMSVSCEYICHTSDEELFVSTECLLSENGKVYVFAKEGNEFKKTEVETGPSNARYTVIYTKLKPGRELLNLEQQPNI